MKKLLLALALASGLLLPEATHANIAVTWLATSTDAGYTQPAPVHGNNPFLKILSISTSTFANGINLTTGCFSVGGVCIGSGGSGAVSSVFGRTGAVVATAGDYTTALVTEVTNLYFTNARAIAATLTGFSATTGTVSSTDSILVAIEKLAGNAASYLTNITGLITPGTNVTISGSGTSGSPYVINATGGSTGLATSSPIASSNLLEYSSAGAGSAFGVATSTLSASSPLTGSFTQIGSGGALGIQAASASQNGYLSNVDFSLLHAATTTAGTGLTYSGNAFNVNTTQNITTLSGLGTGFVQAVSGALSAAALTSGQVTTALGFTPFGGTNPLPIANGGTNATSFTTSGNTIAWNGTSLVTASLTAAQTTPFASSTAISSANMWDSALTSGNCVQAGAGGILTTTAGACGSGGSGITSVGLTLPTGFAVANSPLVANGTIAATLNTGYSIKEIPSWTVGATGSDFTTIQAALNQCGTVGGGQIFLVDPTYAQGSTGLTWKGNNCAIYGRSASTTISFTGATTLFKTNSPAAGYSGDELHNVFLSGDGNTSGVAIDISDMTHADYENVTIDDVGRCIKANDTQNITFYNTIQHINCTTVKTIGIDASSTNPVNANIFNDIFLGYAANVTGVQINNANGNEFNNIRPEPSSVTGTVGLKIFDNTMATNNGVFNNTFSNWYVEANGTGISGTTAVDSGGGIKRNIMNNMTSEANTTDWSLTAPFQSLNSVVNGYDSNFGNPLTSFQGPFGIGTSTELQSIGTTPFDFFGISADNAVSTNEFVLSNSSNRTDILVNNNGQLQVDNGGQINHVISGSAIPFTADSDSSLVPIAALIEDGANFADTSDILKVTNTNGSDTGTTTQIVNVGTGTSFEVDDQANDRSPFVIDASGNTGVGTSTPWRTFAVTGTVAFSGLSSNSGTLSALCLNGSKEVETDAANCITSTERSKQDIHTFDPASALNEVMAFNPVSFFYKPAYNGGYSNDPNLNGEQVGFTAEQIRAIDPRLITITTATTTEPDGTMAYPGMANSVRYENMVAVLTAAIQYQQKEIQALGGGKPLRSMEENWQWLAIGVLVLWNVFLTFRKKK